MQRYNSVKMLALSLIAEKGLRVGDKIPSENEFAAMSGASRITVRHAFRELRESGIIESVQGKGAFLRKSILEGKSFGFVNFLAINDITQVFEGVLHEQLAKRGYDLRYSFTGETPDAHTLKQLEGSSGIIACGWITDEWVDFLGATGISVIIIGSNPVGRIATVKYDHRAAAGMLARRLASGGRSKIGLINGQESYLPAREIAAGYSEALKGLGLAIESRRVLCEGRENTSASMTNYLKKNPDLDAIIVEDGCVMPVFSYLLENGVPEGLEIGLICQPGRKDCFSSNKRITVVSFKETVFGRAADVLFEEMCRKDRMVHSIEPVFV